MKTLPARLTLSLFGTVILLSAAAARATTIDFSISPAPANNVQLTSATFSSNAAASGNGWTTTDGTGATPNIALTWAPMGTAATGGNTLELHSAATFIDAGFTVPILQFDMDNQSNQSPPDPTIDFNVSNNSSFKLISMELGNASDQHPVNEPAYRWVVSLVRLSDMATVMVRETPLMVARDRVTLTFNYQGLPNESYRLHFSDEGANRVRSAIDNLKFSQVPLPSGPALAFNELSATTYTFSIYSDTEAVDLAAAKSLKIDGVEVDATFNIEIGTVTMVTYTPASPPAPGSQHLYEITATGTLGTAITGSGLLRAPWRSNHTGGGSWTTDMVWTRSAPTISSYATAETVLSNAATYPATDRISGAKTNFIHFDDNAVAPLFNSLSTPYPLFDPANGGTGRGTHVDFAMRTTGRISILNGGKCWFLLNTDDGFNFIIDGTSVATQGTRVRLNTLIPVDLTAGPHDVELVHFNRGALAGVSLYLLKGTSDTAPPIWEQSFELLRPVAQTEGLDILSHTFVAGTGTLYLTFSSEAGATYALDYTNGMQEAVGPPAAEKWNVAPGYGSIAGQANSTSIVPLSISSLVAPTGLLPNASRCFFRVRKL